MVTRTPATKCCANPARGHISTARKTIFFMSAPLMGGDSRTLAQPDDGPHVAVNESVISNPTLPPKRCLPSVTPPIPPVPSDRGAPGEL